ncbi:glycosyltransferase family 4 protein [Aquifex aeolicus]|uniref:Mannosyltransferase A n=1 Tax=Aquifex aeolicus (strain VF5) TaxID=224324 RepID=O67183_AQUAE|nr:glycosyltransferase family 1 protein [Aquifex aeolicus]AAC07142.1 mannosyltransferase A [Aquifex aeolicus VF5]
MKKLLLFYTKLSKQLDYFCNTLRNNYELICEDITKYKKFRLNSYDRIVVWIENFNNVLLDYLDNIHPVIILPKNLENANLDLLDEKLIYYAFGWNGLKLLKDERKDLYLLALLKLLINKSKGAILSKDFTKLKKYWLINRNRVKFSDNFFTHSIVEAIEEIYRKDALEQVIKIFSSFISTDIQAKRLSKLVASNFYPNLYERKLFFDISLLRVKEGGTGIHRVVKAQLNCFLENFTPKFRAEPSYITVENGKVTVKYAREFIKNYLKIQTNTLSDVPLLIREGDIYYLPDYYPLLTLEAYKSGFFDYLKFKKTKTVFLVYDLIPIKFPEYFPKRFNKIHEIWLKIVLETSDLIFTISNTVKEDILEFSKKKNLPFPEEKIKVLPLGAETEKAPNVTKVSEKEKEIIQKVSKEPFFLMVSTLEPRKGHFQVLKAFEILWKKGINVNLVIVGKEGWKVRKLVKHIKKHRFLGKHLFWFGYVSDELLKELYKRALALIAASEDEGFGLPIVEAFRNNTPVIARDIKVFREIAGDNAFFFENTKNPEVIANAIKTWLELYRKGLHPKPANLKQYKYTWENHCKLLIKYLTEI